MDPVTPQPGYIGVTSIGGDAGLAIGIGEFLNEITWKPWTWLKIWRDSRFRHAFVWTGSFDTNDGIVEAMPGGAVHVPNHHDLATVAWLMPPDYATGVDTALAAVGMVRTPYSFLDYLALLLRRLHLPSSHLREFIRDSGHAICSQLADRAAMLARWNLFSDGRWEGDVTPLDIYDLIPPS